MLPEFHHQHAGLLFAKRDHKLTPLPRACSALLSMAKKLLRITCMRPPDLLARTESKRTLHETFHGFCSEPECFALSSKNGRHVIRPPVRGSRKTEDWRAYSHALFTSSKTSGFTLIRTSGAGRRQADKTN